MNKFFFLSAALLLGGLTLSSCGDDDDNNSGNSGTPSEEAYKDRSYGNEAIDACAKTVTALEAANEVIATANLNETQETALRQVLTNLVNNVIVPTYTDLADDVEDLEKTLNGLTVSTITQTQIDKACTDFKAARQHWERSEAFLGGAASDFSIDPTIDSWPLDRAELLDYFKGGMTAEIEDESTILGFHALEFILFRNGQNRKVAELQGNDTYKNFEKVSGADELKYAQQVCKLLKERCFQLQVAWEGEKNANRVAVVKAAGLSDDEGSCVAICNEVGTAKIANPFTNGDIAYVESPYSYNSITDFQDNIRSIRNVWFGSLNGNAAQGSFHSFFAGVQKTDVNTSVEGAFDSAINKIGKMPSPFVKYCSIIWNKDFDDPDNWESTTEEEE